VTDRPHVTEAERERVIHVLRESYARGDLDGEEFEEKVKALFAVETSADLRELLPVEYRLTQLPPLAISVDPAAVASVERHLSAGEHMEWVGRPDPTKRFTPADRYLIPFSLLWGGFAIFWLVLATVGGGFFGLFGIPFAAMGLYFIFGRFVYKADRKRRTVYAVTDRRVLEIVDGRKGESVAAVYLRSVPNISTSAVSNGEGSVEFGISSRMESHYANTGMEFFSRGSTSGGVSFFDIDDPEGVADLVERLRAADQAR
jgi:Domain of unknown function (DUF1707)